MNLPSNNQTPDDKPSVNGNSRSQSPWNALRNGSRKSAFLPYKPSVTVLTNLQRGNTKAQTPIIEAEELNFHQKAAQGDLTIKDIEQEADIDAFDEDGLTPLMWASAYGQYPIVDALLQSSAKVDLENPQGQTALLFAAFGGYHEVVRMLIANGADVNHRDETGNTALIYAATGNNPHTTNELLSKNANFALINMYGDSAYSVAVKKENFVESFGLARRMRTNWAKIVASICIQNTNVPEMYSEKRESYSRSQPFRILRENSKNVADQPPKAGVQTLLITNLFIFRLLLLLLLLPLLLL